jgi:hypothetical protein
MKTLRLFRNIATLFIFVTALVVMRPGTGLAVARTYACSIPNLFGPRENCVISNNGHRCETEECTSDACSYSHCIIE